MEEATPATAAPMAVDADALQQFAASLVAEAETQQLVRRLRRAQQTNAELKAELETAEKRLARLRQEKT